MIKYEEFTIAHLEFLLDEEEARQRVSSAVGAEAEARIEQIKAALKLKIRQDATARVAKRLAEKAHEDAVKAKRKRLTYKGKVAAQLVGAGYPLVGAGGASLHELREDVFDAARNKDGFNQYAASMMGGEPYAEWW